MHVQRATTYFIHTYVRFNKQPTGRCIACLFVASDKLEYQPAQQCLKKEHRKVNFAQPKNVNFIDNRRHCSRKRRGESKSPSCVDCSFCTNGNIRRIFGETEKNEQQSCPYLFCELWIKYEETVAASRARWSKPHIPLLNQHSLHSLKIPLTKGIFFGQL
ncbi:electrogenic sodium bicarbonate cotransporter 1 [Trichinella spiralis]|uniref:electrogenic sodium bicarbonate cotransporter 1 n=1 Tax=Trichinella spiralis TaxID=6334 RepID=UPI0001EFD87F|nr:electrogenic sodium bicarbonate cotransporter 1 [Trichinella spiralis]